MVPNTLITDVFNLVKDNNALGTGCPTGVEGLYAIANVQRTECFSAFYEPIMCLVLQGAKEAYMGDRVVRYSAGETLVVSHAVPVEAAVIRAAPDAPYAALALQLDLGLVRSLVDEIDDIDDHAREQHTLDTDAPDAALIDAIARLFALTKDPVDAQALGPLVMREIHFRLLRAKHGGMLRQLLRLESPASRISKVIGILRTNYKSTLPVADLAAECGMSLSAFHDHFRTVTATTPLQYQKELRLMEARRLLTTRGDSVAATAYEVGYESPTQFSREFSRKFGVSPSDVKTDARLVAS